MSAAEPLLADDPLPRERLCAGAALGGSIKERPDDFLVEELPLYEAVGEGEHLYLRVQKHSMPHTEMVEILCRHYGVGEEAVGFAGMKDKVAITSQTVSIHLPGRQEPPPPENDRLKVLWQARHLNKLRRGHLAGNRFAIRVRRIEPTHAPEIWRRLKAVERDGVPDYFGVQRFGYRRNTHRLGRSLLLGDAPGLLAEFLGTRSPYPEHQVRQRTFFDEGNFAESLALWGRNDRGERIALKALADGATAERAVRAIPGAMRLFWISAYQSAVFNRLLDRRLRDGLFASLIEGDVAYRHQSRGMFHVTREVLESEDLAARVRSFELSASGPLMGPGMMEAGAEVATWEREATRELGVPAETLLSNRHGAEGTRRPFRVPVTNCELEAGVDEHGNFVRLAFDLPRGAYATVLLREVLGDEPPED